VDWSRALTNLSCEMVRGLLTTILAPIPPWPFVVAPRLPFAFFEGVLADLEPLAVGGRHSTVYVICRIERGIREERRVGTGEATREEKRR